MTAIFQTFALSGHIIEDTGNLIRVGPESAAQFLRVRDATVTYTTMTGGPTYTDTVPGLQAAVVYGSNPTKTTVDARVARYVTFIIPAHGGTAPLQVAPEGYFNFIAQQTPVIPLDYCLLHEWRPYQNTVGVATPPPGGSFAGGASYGALDSQSFQGGGHVSGLPWTIGNSGAGNAASAAHAFVTVGAAPAGDTTLLDVSFGTSGYLRAKVTSALHIVLESSYQGQLLSNDLGAIQVSQYYWLGCMAFAPLNTGTVVLRGQVWAPGAQLLNSRDVSGGTTITTSTLTAVVGAGETVSGSGYAGFPAATAGWSLSKVLLENVINATLFTPLTADPAPDSGTLGLYLCRQAPGAAATLIDATSAHRDLTAAAGGLTILAAGPYA